MSLSRWLALTAPSTASAVPAVSSRAATELAFMRVLRMGPQASAPAWPGTGPLATVCAALRPTADRRRSANNPILGMRSPTQAARRKIGANDADKETLTGRAIQFRADPFFRIFRRR